MLFEPDSTSLTVFVSYSQVAQVSDLSLQQIEPAFQEKKIN